MGWSDVGLLLIRLVIGGTLILHGWNHWLGGGKIPGTARWFEGLGLRPGRVTATVAGLSELGGGLLTAAGLGSPVGPVAIAGTMAVASAVHRASGPFAADRGYELPVTNLAAALALAVAGPGRYSLDGLTGLRLHRILTGIVVAGAVGGAAVNVAMLLRAAPPVAAPTATAPPAAEAGTPEADAS